MGRSRRMCRRASIGSVAQHCSKARPLEMIAACDSERMQLCTPVGCECVRCVPLPVCFKHSKYPICEYDWLSCGGPLFPLRFSNSWWSSIPKLGHEVWGSCGWSDEAACGLEGDLIFLWSLCLVSS